MSKRTVKHGRQRAERSYCYKPLSDLSGTDRQKAIKLILEELPEEGDPTGEVSVQLRTRKYGNIRTIGMVDQHGQIFCKKTDGIMHAVNLKTKPEADLAMAFANAT